MLKLKENGHKYYFYELLAYSHNGIITRGVTIPQRRGYDEDAKICSKLGLKRHEKYILEQLKQDPDFVKHMRNKLNHIQKRRAKVSQKPKQTVSEDKPLSLDNWM